MYKMKVYACQTECYQIGLATWFHKFINFFFGDSQLWSVECDMRQWLIRGWFFSGRSWTTLIRCKCINNIAFGFVYVFSFIFDFNENILLFFVSFLKKKIHLEVSETCAWNIPNTQLQELRVVNHQWIEMYHI